MTKKTLDKKVITAFEQFLYRSVLDESYKKTNVIPNIPGICLITVQ